MKLLKPEMRFIANHFQFCERMKKKSKEIQTDVQTDVQTETF